MGRGNFLIIILASLIIFASLNLIIFNQTFIVNKALDIQTMPTSNTDYSRFEVTSLSPTQILVTDENGNNTGFNPETGNVVKEIPNSIYSFEAAYADPSGKNPPPPPESGVYTVYIKSPSPTSFRVKVINDVGGLYSFAIYASDRNARTEFDLFENEKLTTEEHIYTFAYNPLAGKQIFSKTNFISTK